MGESERLRPHGAGSTEPTFGRPVHRWVTPLITARNFSSCPSDSISRWTPCPPETASGGFRSALAVSDFRLRARLDVSIPSTSPASEAFNPAFGYSAPHPSTGGTSTLLINALLSAHHNLFWVNIQAHDSRLRKIGLR